MSPHPLGATAPPPALRSRNPVLWMSFFGPGAVIASLTIGAGELIFSTRAGALFGYRLLWFFFLILLLKWALVFTAARQIVLTGAHPFQLWMDLPGPRGWLVWIFFLFAMLCFPVWVFFHAGTLGTLLAHLTGTGPPRYLSGFYLWGAAILGITLVLILSGGYGRLERIQMGIIGLMLASILFSFLLLHPHWGEILKGFLVPGWVDYPDWVREGPFKEVANRPVWLEIVTYVGIIGGSGYDYLAYISYLREKNWGNARTPVSQTALDEIAADAAHPARRWLRAPLIDCTLSFLVVFLFTVLFMVCGAVVLRPQHQLPNGANLLDAQAAFVTPLFPWLKAVYFSGALLAIGGTLYGTIEVAPTILREAVLATNPDGSTRKQPVTGSVRRLAIGWVGLGGLVLLLGYLAATALGSRRPGPDLISLLTPANLFTGVFACGIVCWLNLWTDRRFLPRALRMGWGLRGLNAAAGLLFFGLGMKAYWDYGGVWSVLILGGTLALGWTACWVFQAIRLRKRTPRISPG